MINFRYHVISLTAVFLALALGITMGSTFLNKPFVTGLESQVDIAERKVKDRNSEIDRLRAELDRASREDSAFLTGGLADLSASSLKDEHVAIFTVAGTNGAVIDEVVALLSSAGAHVPAVIRATDRMNLDDAKQADAVASALSVTDTAQADRRSAVLEQLAAALIGSPSIDASGSATTLTTTSTTQTTSKAIDSTTAPGTPTSTTSPTTSSQPNLPSMPGTATTETQPTAAPSTIATTTTVASSKLNIPTVLSRLLAGGFVDIETPNDANGVFDTMPAGTKVVIVVGEGQELDAQQLMLPVAETAAIKHAGDYLVASGLNPGNRSEDATNERVAMRSSIIADFRDSSVLDGKVTTIDNLDSPAGQAATLLSITDRKVGDYGIAEGATAVLPGQG